MEKIIKGYRWLTSDLKSKNGNESWKLGEWKKHEGELKLCESGLHGCRTALQSLNYIYGDMWFIVESRGKIIDEENDKFVASEMRIVKEIDAKKVLVKFAIKCARRCLKNYEKKYPNDLRPRQAIEAAEKYEKEPNEKNREAVWSAAMRKNTLMRSAESAARNAARSAESAVWSAVWSADSAVWSAARSADSAVWSAEKKWQEKTLEKLIKRC